MKVVPFSKRDRKAFLKLNEEFYSTGAALRGYNEKLANRTYDYLMSKHENIWGYLLIDKDYNQAVGYMLLTSYWCNEEGGNVIVLDELYISPVDRHKGYGRLLMEWIESQFSDSAVSIDLEVLSDNTHAIELYQKAGYVADGFMVMSKRLKNSIFKNENNG